jgi:hypothetical protein
MCSNEIDIVIIKNNIISGFHHLIFCDLTVGRSDVGLLPFCPRLVNDFIYENRHNINKAYVDMFSCYKENEDLESLMEEEIPLDWFSEFLYKYVTTNLGGGKSENDDFREDDTVDMNDEDDADY